MNDEIMKSVQKGSIMGVANLMKETYQVRRDSIKGLDSCSAVIVSYPYLSNANLVNGQLFIYKTIASNALLSF